MNAQVVVVLHGQRHAEGGRPIAALAQAGDRAVPDRCQGHGGAFVSGEHPHELRAQGLGEPGQILHVVLSENATNEPHRLLAASVGVAIPGNPDNYGYLSEHHSFGQTDDVAGDYAEDLAAGMLATILGVDFDPDKSYDEKKELWRISRQIVRTMHITQSAVGDKTGLWTTVIAGAVLI